MRSLWLSCILCVLLLLPSLAMATGVCTAAAGCGQTGVPIILSTSGIPFIKASSGTMGNNGAISAMTALPRTYSGGAWLWLPAGAVAAGVPASASWLWFVASSTTAGTVYNSTYTSGQPVIGTQTAFSTTGPGAYTGSTSTIFGPTITLPANTMGANGMLAVSMNHAYNNTAGTKTGTFTFGGTSTLTTVGQTTSGENSTDGYVYNRGITNAQTYSDLRGNAAGSAAGLASPTPLAIDTTANVTLQLSLACNTATDHHILESYSLVAYPQN